MNLFIERARLFWRKKEEKKSVLPAKPQLLSWLYSSEPIICGGGLYVDIAFKSEEVNPSQNIKQNQMLTNFREIELEELKKRC